jgi:hypothetical protein
VALGLLDLARLLARRLRLARLSLAPLRSVRLRLGGGLGIHGVLLLEQELLLLLQIQLLRLRLLLLLRRRLLAGALGLPLLLVRVGRLGLLAVRRIATRRLLRLLLALPLVLRLEAVVEARATLRSVPVRRKR